MTALTREPGIMSVDGRGASGRLKIGTNGLRSTVKPPKIRLSDGSGGETITTAAQFEYDRHEFGGYFGGYRENVGLYAWSASRRESMISDNPHN